MVQQATKSRKSAQRVVTIIAGFRKPSGTICARVRNDKGSQYLPKVYADGHATCTCAAYDPEKGKGKHECYHVKAVREVAHIFGTEGILVEQVAAQAEAANMKKLAEQKLDKAYALVGDPRVEHHCVVCGTQRCNPGKEYCSGCCPWEY